MDRYRVSAAPDPSVLFSRDALRRAWRLTRQNGDSPGVDHVTLTAFEQHLKPELERLRWELLDGNYRPRPVQRYYKLKPSGKKRALSIWSVRDRVAQRVILEYITPILERLYLPCSYGFRLGRTVAQAVHAVQTALDQGRHWLVDADIADCFDSIPIEPLLARVREAIPSAHAVTLIGLWLQTPVKGHNEQRAGVSQGAVISPQLTNLYLHTFDQIVTTQMRAVSLVRFADDFVILCPTHFAAEAALTLTERILNNLGLKLNPAKTRLIHRDQGMDFLGVHFSARPHS